MWFRRQGSRFTRHRAFTLVELLVVMAIISVLAGMLLPALSQAISAARSAACMSQQKQIGLAMGMYASDNNGYIIPWTQGASTNTSPLYLWDEVLASYVGVEIDGGLTTIASTSGPQRSKVHGPIQMFLCPLDKLTHPNAAYFPSTYALNRRGIFPSPYYNQFVKESRIRAAGSTLSMAERPSTIKYFGGGTASNADNPNDQFNAVVGLHRASDSDPIYAYLFFDGHVQLLSAFATMGPAGVVNTNAAGMWTLDPND